MSTGIPNDDASEHVQPPAPRPASGGFDAKSLTPPQWLVIGGAVVYFIALLLPWVSVSFDADGLEDLGSIGGSSNGIGDGLLLFSWLLLAAAAAWLLLPLFGVRIDAPIPRPLVTLGLTGLALLFTLIKFIDVLTSGGDVEGFGVDVSTGFGAYLGFLAALAAVGGAVLLFLAERQTAQPAV